MDHERSVSNENAPALKINNLRVGFGKIEVLSGIRMEVPKHQITCIVGQSGCGKSTLLKTINRIVEEEGGRIRGDILLEERNIMNLKVEELRKRIGLVFQQPISFPMSIERNLSYILAYHGTVQRSEQKKKVEYYLRQAKLWDEVKDKLTLYAQKLSGGQQQRLSIARCLCAEPDVLLLDEPCSALDIKNAQAMEELLLELKENYTILMVTHNLAQAKRVSDEMIFLHQGRVIEQAPNDVFFDHPVTELAKDYIAFMN